jgi:hypothetical protein
MGCFHTQYGRSVGCELLTNGMLRERPVTSKETRRLQELKQGQQSSSMTEHKI